ncbi:MAG: hypothetical protein GY953_12545, partial [bacterium]|nr:hypothetical protein [bacterium]
MIVSEAHGIPTFVKGELGFVDPMPTKAAGSARDEALFRLSAKTFLEDLVTQSFGATGSEELQAVRVGSDDLGTVHVRFHQFLNGLRVVGAELIVHADAGTGEVYAVGGRFAPDSGVAIPTKAMPSIALLGRLAKIGVVGKPMAEPEKLYFHDAETGITHLAWKVRVQGTEDGQFFDNEVYIDAQSLKVVAVDANVHTAKVRATYDATGSVVTNTSITGLPGTLVCNESTTNCNDASAQRAHDGAGDVYDYYQTRFGRDSLNGSGMTLTSSVHVGSNWANAAWYNN